ncbi:DUF2635 domain-containing protein [Pseudomonas violetae]|jgi:hypothetical protein|uniref:DUF2635 domain-containing protein n=2 Tax=Pseudomonas TaxID=286 RepID=A0ABT0EZJ1_9PSED|nr:DUF2635 domain-containing protein [Pseudomonas violetae]MCK1791167.1 DUF2635 domain-containing protein [Pseudomonas violetae]
MRVIATTDPVPMQPDHLNKKAGFIQPEPAEAVEVANTSYYQRRIAAGELRVIADTKSPGRSAKQTAKGVKQ